MTFVQAPLFSDAYERSSRQLPVLGEQRDIAYVGTRAKSVLNGPEVTNMGFWSINPYIGSAAHSGAPTATRATRIATSWSAPSPPMC
jgi:hypothetical protein